MKTYTAVLEIDPETLDLVLPLSEEILQETGWGLNDTLEWIDNNDGTVTIKRVENA